MLKETWRERGKEMGKVDGCVEERGKKLVRMKAFVSSLSRQQGKL